MAISQAGVSGIAGGVSDLFAAYGDKLKAQGDRLEGQNYDLAAQYALKEEHYTELSTGIKEMQQTRENTQALGATTADVAGAGFAASGSAMDLLRDSASQGALAKQVLGQQGLIQEEGYKEQAQSYENMSAAAGIAAKAEDSAALGAEITGGIKILTGGISMLPMPGGG